MNPVLHPFFVHFPVALGFLVPFLIAWSIIQFKRNESTANTLWTTIVITLVIMTFFTIMAILTGEVSHEVLEKYMDDKPIEKHEEFAEIYAVLLYAVTGLSFFIYIFKAQRRYYFMIGLLLLSLAMLGLGMVSGKTGGEIVHKFESPQYLNKAIKEGALENLGKHEHSENQEREAEESK